MSVPVERRRGGRVGPQVNKFEQVLSDEHQMSVGGSRPQVLCRGGGYPTIP